MRDLGMTPEAIKTLVGSALPTRTLSRYLERYSPTWLAQGLQFDEEKSGAPIQVDEAQRDEIEVKLRSGKSTRQVALLVGVSQATVVRVAKERELVAKVCVYRPFLTEHQVAARLAFAKKWHAKPANWFRDVLWTDESSVRLQPSHKRIVWVDEGAHPENMRVSKFAKTVWVWAGISWRGATDLVVLEFPKNKGFTGSEYRFQVLEKWKTITKKINSPNMLVMEDGSRIHHTPSNKTVKQRKGINTFPGDGTTWPANSPDLNPIENVWAEMKRYIHSLPEYPKDRDTMVYQLKKFWKTMTIERCRSYIEGYDSRLKAVIEQKGDTSGY
jgi:transposase